MRKSESAPLVGQDGGSVGHLDIEIVGASPVPLAVSFNDGADFEPSRPDAIVDSPELGSSTRGTDHEPLVVTQTDVVALGSGHRGDASGGFPAQLPPLQALRHSLSSSGGAASLPILSESNGGDADTNGAGIGPRPASAMAGVHRISLPVELPVRGDWWWKVCAFV